MNRHNTDTHEAARLARLAVMQRANGDHAAADKNEARALLLCGYTAPAIRTFVPAVAPSRIPGGKAAASILLGLALVAGAAGEAHASCHVTTPDALDEDFEAAGIPEQERYELAKSYCEAAERPGTREWATERMVGCFSVDSPQAWLAVDARGMFYTVCADGNGTPWLVVRP